MTWWIELNPLSGRDLHSVESWHSLRIMEHLLSGMAQGCK